MIHASDDIISYKLNEIMSLSNYQVVTIEYLNTLLFTFLLGGGYNI